MNCTPREGPYVGSTLTVTLTDVRDEDEQPVAGVAVTAAVDGPNLPVIPSEVEALTGGRYKVSFLPTEVGRYDVSLRLNKGGVVGEVRTSVRVYE